MGISKKVKVGLDETRMEILGVQVLIGFQFRSVFQNAYENIPVLSRYLDGLALLLLLLALALLILPGPYHRIVERGNNSGKFMALTSAVASLALAPFAISIALAVGIACERIWGPVGAVIAGGSAGAIALLLWYGFGQARRESEGKVERAMSERKKGEVEDPGLHEKIDQLLTEARVILPGAQALLGFQLAIVLTEAFEKLSPDLKSIHGLALGLVCMSMILLITPAAYHRIVYAGEDSERFHRVASAIIMSSTIPLALGVAADVFVVGTRIVSSIFAASVAAFAALCLMVGCWHIFPIVARKLESQTICK